MSVAFSPNGKTILTGSADETARLWSVEGKLLQIFRFNNTIDSVAFSPNNKTILIENKLWNIKFDFIKSTSIASLKLTSNEIVTMAKVGVKVRYDNEQKLHKIQATDLPNKLIDAVELDMSGLYLDELPSWLGKFKNLRYLNLSNNQLTLEYLGVLRELKKLENLNLSHNPIFEQFTTTYSKELFENLKNLRELNLKNTKMIDFDRNLFKYLGNLVIFNISNNAISNLTISMADPFDLNTSSLNKLEKLYANNNAIKTIDLSRLSNLKELNLSHNNMIKLDLDNITNNIQRIDISYNNLKTINFNEDKGYLEILKLSNNRYLEIPPKMGKLFVLQNLKILEVDSSVNVPNSLKIKLK